MKLPAVVLVAVFLLSSTPVWAQSNEGRTPQPRRMDFSARAAGLARESLSQPRPTLGVTAAPRTDALRSAPTAQTSVKKPFWKSPWLYVAIGAGVGAALFIASRGEDGIGGLY